MKKVYGLLAVLVISAAAMAQPTQREKEVVKNDLARERNKRNDVARDLLHGQPERARADHNAAVAYHVKAHRDISQVHRNEAVRRSRYHPHHYYVRHHRHYYHRHYVHHRPAHARVVVDVRH